MANEEVKTDNDDGSKWFNVKNTSVRLVHIGGVSIAPGHIVPVLDDEAGINRIDVDGSEHLEATDEEASDSPTNEVIAKESKKAVGRKTATGAGWSAKKN